MWAFVVTSGVFDGRSCWGPPVLFIPSGEVVAQGLLLALGQARRVGSTRVRGGAVKLGSEVGAQRDHGPSAQAQASWALEGQLWREGLGTGTCGVAMTLGLGCAEARGVEDWPWSRLQRLLLGVLQYLLPLWGAQSRNGFWLPLR